MDGREEYRVSRVEDSHKYPNWLQYLIQLTDYNSITWKPATVGDEIQAMEELLGGLRVQSSPGIGIGLSGGATVTLLLVYMSNR